MISFELAQKKYRHAERTCLTPRSAIFLTLSEGINACKDQDIFRVTRALHALRNSLKEIGHPLLAAQMHGILDYCLKLAFQRKYSHIADALIPLRDCFK